MSKDKVIKATEDYTSKDLLHFGVDHLRSSKFLYDAVVPSFYDSAGHLSYLGIELLLKAWLIYLKGNHPKEHGLISLWGELTSLGQISLSEKNMKWIQELDKHYRLRYPALALPIETASDDWDKTESLFSELCLLLPISLQEQIKTLSPIEKGNRILMGQKVQEKGESPL